MMEFNEQDIQYLLNVVAQRPLAEALPLFLKMTNQRLVPEDGRPQGQLSPVRSPPRAE